MLEFEPIRYVTIRYGIAFSNATEAPYTLSYSIKGIYKKEEKYFAVAKLEGLWWVDGNRKALDPRKVEPSKMKTSLRYPIAAAEVVKG
ncbi:hypothetical protein [Paenibacillus sp. Soil787]|uniref:hypothetical protein n=1 Tax=Paenibacillus sp. Soil787 TaxID=1736411 RepID=UPI0012E3B9C7|nr:hypothetical protein [Paenibacillus sp. Soil787]